MSRMPRLLVGISLWIVAEASTRGEDAAAIVRTVREQEAWVDRLDSLWLKAKVQFERTPQGIAKNRRELEKRFPGLALDGKVNLRAKGTQTVELAFDRTR